MRQVKLPRFPRPSTPIKLIADIVKFITLAVALFIIFMLFRITAQNNQLAQQAKNTAEQNQRIAKANGQHIDCIAKLFAAYTRDKTPITLENLDKCKATAAETSAIMSGAVDFSPTQTHTSPVPTNQNTNNSTNNTTSQERIQQTAPSEQGQTKPPSVPNIPTPPQEVLGVPLCVPFTQMCVR